jgi:hypothetical protein
MMLQRVCARVATKRPAASFDEHSASDPRVLEHLYYLDCRSHAQFDDVERSDNGFLPEGRLGEGRGVYGLPVDAHMLTSWIYQHDS